MGTLSGLKTHLVLILSTATFCASSVSAFADADIWSKDGAGNAWHAQSGLQCPLNIETRNVDPNWAKGPKTMALQSVVVAASNRKRGDHVACEYEAANGGWATVEIVKMNDDEDVDDFARSSKERLHATFPDLKRNPFSAQYDPMPRSPSGGSTFVASYQNAGKPPRKGAIALAGGETSGWTVVLIQFDYDRDGYELQMIATGNWNRLARTRR